MTQGTDSVNIFVLVNLLLVKLMFHGRSKQPSGYREMVLSYGSVAF